MSAKEKTHKDDIERLTLPHSALVSIDGETAILSNLHRMSVLLENLDSEFLVDEIVLGEKNVKGQVIGHENGVDSIGLEGRY